MGSGGISVIPPLHAVVPFAQRTTGALNYTCKEESGYIIKQREKPDLSTQVAEIANCDLEAGLVFS